jgi:putative toxin-antitoxin system antitoxin component (TIGR02293 family)
MSYTELRGIDMIAPESIAEILGLGASVRTVGELESAVSEGLPKRALERLSARLYQDRRSASAYKFKVVPQATWKRRSKRLSVDESEKTERLARVLAAAEYVWDDREQAREWMSKPHRELNGQTPLEAARTELGARRVEDLLDKLYFGLPV